MKLTSILAVVMAVSFSASMDAAAPGEKRIDGSSWIGCIDRDHYEELVEIASTGDNEAFRKTLVARVLVGQCIMFKDKETVYVTDTAIFSGLVQLRKKGETTKYWTGIEAID